jgi:RNA polymerase sigma factor (TIGR02999 family)
MVVSSSIADTVTRAEAGDATAAAQLVELLYVELRKLARARLAKRAPGRTIQATELVHEAYLRVAGRKEHGWDGRGHFFFAAARAMHDIMIERGRKKKAVRHGGALVRVEIAGSPSCSKPRSTFPPPSGWHSWSGAAPATPVSWPRSSIF